MWEIGGGTVNGGNKGKMGECEGRREIGGCEDKRKTGECTVEG